jgi:hypothetical protein
LRRWQGCLAFCTSQLSTLASQVFERGVGVVREHALEPGLRLLLLLAGAAGAPPDLEAARRGGRPVPAVPAVEQRRRGEDRKARGGRDGRARSEGGGAWHVATQAEAVRR